MPNKDTKNSVNQMLDLKEYFSKFKLYFAIKNAHTRTELEKQCHSMCRLATMCLQLDGAIELEAQVQQKESMEMTM